MTDLHGLLEKYVANGALPGAVALLASADRTEVAAVGSASLGGVPMARDSIFRIASITKPITAASVMMLIDDGRIALGDPVRRWLPELAEPVVVRTPASELDDVVPAARPITVADLLTSTAGYGFASDFSLPAVQRLFSVQKDGREPRSFLPPDEWLAELATIPLLYQPGEGWLYDTCSTLQGVLVARVCGQSLPDFMAERVLGPLGMADTGFDVPASQRHRFTSYYRAGPGGGLELAGGVAASGRRVLSAESVRLMTTDHTTPAHREIGALFLEGQGWGFGGSVDIAPADPWIVPGRYGWVGGTGTSAHITPSTGTVAILLTQVAADSPVPPGWMREFWRYASGTAKMSTWE